MNLEGVVKKVNSKGYKGRGGKSGLVYSFLLVTDSNEDNWVTFGFDKEPPFEEGDRIAFEYTEKNGYKTYTEGTGRIIPVTKREAAPAAQAAAQQTAPSTQAGSTDRQGQIVWQHSQEMAIAKIALLLQHDGLPMSVAKTKAAQAQRYAEISAAIDKETVKAYNDVITGRVLEHVADAGVVDTSAPDNIPSAGQKTEQQSGGEEFK